MPENLSHFKLYNKALGFKGCNLYQTLIESFALSLINMSLSHPLLTSTSMPAVLSSSSSPRPPTSALHCSCQLPLSASMSTKDTLSLLSSSITNATWNLTAPVWPHPVQHHREMLAPYGAFPQGGMYLKRLKALSLAENFTRLIELRL